MLQLSGSPHPDPDPQHAGYPEPPLGAGYLSVEYDPRPTAAREARVEVRRQLERWGLAERDAAGAGDGAGGDLVDVTELLVSELVTNALLHSRSRFRLTLSAAHGVLRCEVTDSGRRIPRVVEAGTSESGRGMFLVDALALRWGCHQDGPGKTVWFELGTCGLDGCGRRQP
ncbi:ATP-binding protein [Streptomyces sp. NPDC047081]|uniref:ATP-binding protein n=1 Tax=Streptomyces sp. NPDC047081 TaxID=3154706 RepID=UPI0033D10756